MSYETKKKRTKLKIVFKHDKKETPNCHDICGGTRSSAIGENKKRKPKQLSKKKIENS